MQKLLSLSSQEVRKLVLDAQGLFRPNSFGQGRSAVLKTLEHLSYVQIDTISVVARAHHHVIWSRVPDYSLSMLDRLLEERSVFEYWSHAASYLPMRDYRFSLPRKLAYAKRKSHWFRKNRKLMRSVLDRIRAEGPLQAKDFEGPRGHKSSGWFDWKPAKIALEQLFMSGELMVRERKGFQKVYDLAERVLPTGLNIEPPSPLEIARHWVENTLRSHGIASEAEMRYLRRGNRRELVRVLREMEESGEILRVRLPEEGKHPHFALSAALSSSEFTALKEPRIQVLSPFDNLVIQRKKLLKHFAFDYQIECYVPEPKRKFGYFCLPLLYVDRDGGHLIGRIDAKAERETGVLRIRTLFLEDQGVPKKFRIAPEMPELQNSLESFSEFNGCSELKIESVRRIKSSI